MGGLEQSDPAWHRAAPAAVVPPGRRRARCFQRTPGEEWLLELSMCAKLSHRQPTDSTRPLKQMKTGLCWMLVLGCTESKNMLGVYIRHFVLSGFLFKKIKCLMIYNDLKQRLNSRCHFSLQDTYYHKRSGKRPLLFVRLRLLSCPARRPPAAQLFLRVT